MNVWFKDGKGAEEGGKEGGNKAERRPLGGGMEEGSAGSTEGARELWSEDRR